MKRYLLLLFALACIVPQIQAQREAVLNVEAEEKPQSPVNNIIKISPFHFIEGTFLLSYERMLKGGSMSIMLNAGVHSRERVFDGGDQFGFQEELQLRFYVIPPKNTSIRARRFAYFKGLYAGPFLGHRYRDESISVFDWILQQTVGVQQNVNEFSGGVILGSQIAFGNRLFLDVWVGGGVKRSTGRDPSVTNVTAVEVGYNGVIPKGGIQLGVGF
ncbi:MAG: hypothetical protein AAGN35_25890 [Bacteroidota bacterium]